MKNKILIFLFVGSSLAIRAQKTAFVNEGKLLAALPGYTYAIKETDSIKKVFENEIVSSKQNLNTKYQTLLAPYKLPENITLEELQVKLSDIDKQKLELYQDEGKLIEKQIKSKQSEFENLYKQKVGKLIERLNDVIKTYCKENKIDVLLKIDILGSSVAYYDESKEVTNALLDRIKVIK